MLYAKFDTGYKAGGFNFGGSAYAPETVKAYEVGSKNRFLDNTLQLNVAAFYDDYTDQQVATYTFLATGQPVQLTQNAGASRNYGAEAELLYRIPVIGTLNFSADYLHARYTNFLSVADPSDPKASGNVQLAGNQPPQAPTWSFGMGLEHSWEVAGGSLTGRIQSKAQSSYYFSFYNFPDTRQTGYTMSDAFLIYQPDAGHWKVTAFVRNLENSVVFKDAEESQYAVAYAYEFYPPRTYGGRVEYSW
jgi:iron complex outermembrane receptor protein